MGETVEPPVSQNSFSIQINYEYIKSVIGILRAVIIVSLFIGFVCSAAATTFNNYSYPQRDAYLAFSIIGLIISIFLYIINLIGFINHGFFQRLPRNLINLILDAIFGIVFLILACTSAWYASFFMPAAWGIASFVGFVACISYIADAVLHFRDSGLRLSFNQQNSNTNANTVSA